MASLREASFCPRSRRRGRSSAPSATIARSRRTSSRSWSRSWMISRSVLHKRKKARTFVIDGVLARGFYLAAVADSEPRGRVRGGRGVLCFFFSKRRPRNLRGAPRTQTNMPSLKDLTRADQQREVNTQDHVGDEDGGREQAAARAGGGRGGAARMPSGWRRMLRRLAANVAGTPGAPRLACRAPGKDAGASGNRRSPRIAGWRARSTRASAGRRAGWCAGCSARARRSRYWPVGRKGRDYSAGANIADRMSAAS